MAVDGGGAGCGDSVWKAGSKGTVFAGVAIGIDGLATSLVCDVSLSITGKLDSGR